MEEKNNYKETAQIFKRYGIHDDPALWQDQWLFRSVLCAARRAVCLIRDSGGADPV